MDTIIKNIEFNEKQEKTIRIILMDMFKTLTTNSEEAKELITGIFKESLFLSSEKGIHRIRDENQLISSLTSWHTGFGKWANDDYDGFDLLASSFYLINKTHPLYNGNKRTSCNLIIRFSSMLAPLILERFIRENKDAFKQADRMFLYTEMQQTIYDFSKRNLIDKYKILKTLALKTASENEWKDLPKEEVVFMIKKEIKLFIIRDLLPMINIILPNILAISKINTKKETIIRQKKIEQMFDKKSINTFEKNTKKYWTKFEDRIPFFTMPQIQDIKSTAQKLKQKNLVISPFQK